MKTTTETLCVVRVSKADGEAIALFPETEDARGICDCYTVRESHGSADYRALVGSPYDAPTRPASPEERDAMAAILRRLGYNLKLRARFTRSRSRP